MVQNKKFMPLLVVIIAMGFHGIDIFTEYDITLEQLAAIDIFLTPFGLGGLLRAGHKSYLASKQITSSEISPEDLLKLKELLNKIKT